MRSAGIVRAASVTEGRSEAMEPTTMAASRIRQGSRTKARRSGARARRTPYSSAKAATMAHSIASIADSAAGGRAKSIGASPVPSAASARKPMTASLSRSERRRSMVPS